MCTAFQYTKVKLGGNFAIFHICSSIGNLPDNLVAARCEIRISTERRLGMDAEYAHQGARLGCITSPGDFTYIQRIGDRQSLQFT